MPDYDRKNYIVEGEKDDFLLSLAKITSKKIKDVVGYITTEYGEPQFEVMHIVFDDDTKVWLHGEHDSVVAYEGYRNGRRYRVFDKRLMDYLNKSDPNYYEEDDA